MWDPDTLDTLKTFKTNRPVNSAAMSPLKDQVMLGGGQDAREVTTTTTRERFEVRFFHSVFEDEIGRVKGHFGPINTLAFHPDGRGYVESTPCFPLFPWPTCACRSYLAPLSVSTVSAVHVWAAFFCLISKCIFCPL